MSSITSEDFTIYDDSSKFVQRKKLSEQVFTGVKQINSAQVMKDNNFFSNPALKKVKILDTEISQIQGGEKISPVIKRAARRN